MKKILPLLFLSILCYFSFWIDQTNKQSLVIPAAEMEEGGEGRAEWELARLADPETGLLPPNYRKQELAYAANLPKAIEHNYRNQATWQNRGPWNFGGRTRAIAMDVTNEKRMIAGSVSGGIFITEDGGDSWTPAKGFGNNIGITSISQDKRSGKTNIWYACSGEAYGASQSGGDAYFLGDGFFKSIDNGVTWSPLASTSIGVAEGFTNLFQLGWKIITDPSNNTNDVVYAATYGAIYRSVNGGTTWSIARGGQPYSYFTDVAVTSTGVLYATMSSEGAQRGIWRSTNGTQWVNITPKDFPPKYDRIVIGINPNNENEVYFLGNTDGYGHSNYYISSLDWSSLWKYTYIDGNGTNGTWNNLSSNLPNKGTQFDRFSCQGGYDLVVKVQPNTNHVFIGGAGLYRSNDGFSTPNNTTQIGGYKIGTDLPFFEIYPTHHPDQHDVLFLPSDPKVMISASDGGINLTQDANAAFVQWKSLNNGYITTQLYTVMIEPTMKNDPTIIGGFQDNGNFMVTSNDPKKPWVQTVNGDGAFGAIGTEKKNYYLSIQEGKIAKCDIDKDGKVVKFNRIDPIGGKGYQFINQLVLDRNNENTMYVAGGKRIWRNNQLDKIQLEGKWDSISTGWFAFPDTIKGTGRVTAIAVSAKPANVVYYGSDNGKIYRIENAHLDDSKPVELSISNARNYVSCITIDPDNANNIIVTYSNYKTYSIYQSKDAGKTWAKVAGNLDFTVTAGSDATPPSIRWISILKFPNGAKKYFAATSVGLYSADSLSTANGGTKWVQEGASTIGNVVCNHVETRSSDGLVVVATHGAGTFAANFEAPLINTADAKSNFSNLELYPNPAHDVLYFKTNLDLDNNSKILIYDIKGSLMQQVVQSANPIPINELPKGIYIIKIKNAKGEAIRRFVKN
jgi:hypothetical protein